MFLHAHGAGKTYTIVKRIEKELEQLNSYQGIIACSFTKEASAELKNRINTKLDLENSYIGTIDSFVKYIITSFVNRAFKNLNKFNKQVMVKNDIYFPNNNIAINGTLITKNDNKLLTMNELIRLYDVNGNYEIIGNKYYKEWIEKLQNNEYEISFPAYFFASYIIKMNIFKQWFSKKYTTIYVDEAQDLNWFQHYFFNTIKEQLSNVNMVMVGDARQSIYQFRGARPELFEKLSETYNKYSIDVSVRCHPSIMYYANKIYNNNKNKINFETKVKIIDNINKNFLQGMKGDTYILVESHETAVKMYEMFKEDFDILYTKVLDLDNKNFNDYYVNRDIVDELLKYYLNYTNPIDRNKYSFERIQPLLKNSGYRYNQKDFVIRNISLVDFLKTSRTILGISLCDNTINEIAKKFEDEKYKYSYYIVEKPNRIMTIHYSKGLESENVVIVLDSPYNKITNEFKNKLFVAITRAKKNVYIHTENNEIVKNFIIQLLS